MPVVPAEIEAQRAKLDKELTQRAKRHAKLEEYYEGNCPLPAAVEKAKLTKAYRLLMPVSEAPWGSLVVDSTQDRLEVSGIDSGDDTVDEAIWGAWQDNQMDAESKIAQNATLVDGRSHALVWRPPGSDRPEITLDNAATMVVQYREGSRRHRVAALRRWKGDDDKVYATLYRPDGIYKFIQDEAAQDGAGGWQAREVIGADGEPEAWPLENPYKVVPVVEIAINRRLKPGAFAHARGEYAHCLGLIDRINLLTFLGLVVAFWMGFPLRGVLGAEITRRVLEDDEGNPILDSKGEQKTVDEPPFKADPGTVAQIEDPAAKIFEFKAADRENLSVLAELDQLATITKTPRHYFPMKNGMSNLSADAIRASEGGLHAKVTQYKASLGEGWEEVLRLCGLMLDEPVDLSPRAELKWKDHDSRSLAERADAAVKLAGIDGFPFPLIAEKYLNLTRDEINRAESQMAGSVITKLIEAAASTPTDGRALAGANGNGGS